MSASVRRLIALIEATLRLALPSRTPVPLIGRTLPLDSALFYTRMQLGDGWVPDRSSRLSNIRLTDPRWKVVDGVGHSRPGYRGLLLHAIMRAGVLDPSGDREELLAGWDESSWTQSARQSADRLAKRSSLSASDGAAIVDEAMLALAVSVPFRKRESTAPAVRIKPLEQLAALQQKTGAFLARSSSDNPETTWYFELMLLHVISVHAHTYATPLAVQAMHRSAKYVAAEIQPDHATTQPWGVLGLLTVADGISVADSMLHSAGVQQPSTMDAPSILLLTDVLHFAGSRVVAKSK